MDLYSKWYTVSTIMAQTLQRLDYGTVDRPTDGTGTLISRYAITGIISYSLVSVSHCRVATSLERTKVPPIGFVGHDPDGAFIRR